MYSGNMHGDLLLLISMFSDIQMGCPDVPMSRGTDTEQMHCYIIYDHTILLMDRLSDI